MHNLIIQYIRTNFYYYFRFNGPCNDIVTYPTKKYNGTLGHKVNHDFIPNSIFINVETPRFGVIVGIKTVEPVMMDQEYFTNYRYSMETAPEWYRNCFNRFNAIYSR